MEQRVAELEAENASLKQQLEELHAKYDRLRDGSSKRVQFLTDENEVLAEANHELMQKQAALDSAADALRRETEDAALSKVPDDLLLPGEGVQVTALATLANVHTMGNLLTVAAPVTHSEIAVTGGVDKFVMVHDWKQQRRLCAYPMHAPVLEIVFNPNPEAWNYFLVGLMDATHAVLRLVQENGEWVVEEVAQFHDHSRHGAMRVVWNAQGTLFATGSTDKTVNIYRCSHIEAGDALPTCEKVKTFYFNATVEAMTFVPALEGRNELLAIAVRDDCYIHYVDCETMGKERINMNQDGIEHVSYDIMDLHVSPSGKYLLAATDKDRHFIFAVKQNAVLRSFYGHAAGAYSQPRAIWHPSEKYIISNNEVNGNIFVWNVASENVVEQLGAHERLIRGIVCTADQTLLSVSYDKQLKAWNALALDPVV